MAYQGVLDDIKRCTELRVPERYPVMALTEQFDVRQAGLTYEEYAASADNVAKSHIGGVEAYDYDWACVYIDDCMEFEPLGVETVGSGDIPRSVSGYLPATRGTLSTLRMPDPSKDGRMPILLEGIRKVRERLGDSLFICGHAVAPFSAVALFLGIKPAMMLMYDDPGLLRDFMRFAIELEHVYGAAQLRAGAHGLWVGDCCASSRFLSLRHYEEFAAGPAAEHVRRLKRLGATTIYFGAEKAVPHLAASAQLGSDIIALGEDADLAECKAAVGDRVCLMGNLDPIRVMLYGDPRSVESEVERIFDSVGRWGGHLFNTGEGVPPETPPANVRAMVRALRECGFPQSRRVGS